MCTTPHRKGAAHFSQFVATIEVDLGEHKNQEVFRGVVEEDFLDKFL
jgi:hypothetical protein